MWANSFSPRLTPTEFRSITKQNSVVLYKQKARQCTTCKGTGKIRRTKRMEHPLLKQVSV